LREVIVGLPEICRSWEKLGEGEVGLSDTNRSWEKY